MGKLTKSIAVALSVAAMNSTINASNSLGAMFSQPNKLDQQREVNKMRGKDRNGLPKKRRKMW